MTCFVCGRPGVFKAGTDRAVCRLHADDGEDYMRHQVETEYSAALQRARCPDCDGTGLQLHGGGRIGPQRCTRCRGTGRRRSHR